MIYNNIAFFISGAECPSTANPLDSKNGQKHICEQLRGNQWSQIKCRRFRAHGYFKNCSNWCHIFARCFNENGTAHWAQQCSAMFRFSSPTQLAAAGDNASSLVMDTFHVHPCPRNTFAIRVSRCNCTIVGKLVVGESWQQFQSENLPFIVSVHK